MVYSVRRSMNVVDCSVWQMQLGKRQSRQGPARTEAEKAKADAEPTLAAKLGVSVK